MSELPKFVLQRLQPSAAAGEHPSADLLAAFVEQALAGAEREKLLTHVAGCEHCREVIWRAIPESEAAHPVAAQASSRGWFWSPAWRWAGVAAGVIVLAGVAVVYHGGPGPAAEKAASKPAAVAQNRDTQSLEAKQEPAAPEARLDMTAAPPKASPQSKFDKEVGSARRPEGNLVAKDMQPKILPVPREQTSANEIGAENAKSADEMAAAAPAPAPAAPAANSLGSLSAAKTRAASTAQAGVMIASNVPARSLGKKKLAPPTRWMLSSEGALLRSTDAGKNWQTVPFEDNVVFRAVAVVGPRVWAGGQGGALYFSADDGSQWQRLSPAANGTVLAEDITALTFSDAQHGSLTTAGGQTWTTSDGSSWQKQ